MSKQQKRTKRKFIIIAFAVIAGLILMAVGGIFALKTYQKQQENKIYSTSDRVSLPSFDIEIIKAEAKPVDLPLDKELVSRYGGLEGRENCNTLSGTSSRLMVSGQAYPTGPSEKTLCIWRNNSRNDIDKYSSENKQFVIDYKITATESVETASLKIELIPDSGRKLDERVNLFNGNEFMQESFYKSFMNDGTVVANPDPFEYKPFSKSDIGGNIGKGLIRTGYLYTDVRNSENTIDVVISYKEDGKAHTRTIRVNLRQN